MAKKQERQITPKGDSPQILEELVDGYNVMNWHGYKVLVGRGKSPFFFNEIEQRRNDNRSNMIVVTGSPGEGKSYFALRLAEILDQNFDVEEQVVFDRLNLLTLIGNDSPLKRGQVIVIDEAQFVAGARRWYEEIQKDLMEHLEAVRSKGFIIIIVALHLDLLDKVVRKYVLSFMIFIEQRGKGVAYRLFTPRFESDMYRNRLGKINLKLPDYAKCSHVDCLRCKYLGECMTSRAVYERRKKDFLAMKAQESIAELQKKEVTKINNEDIALWINENHVNAFEYTNRGTLKPTWIQQEVLKGMMVRLPLHRCIQVQRLYATLYGVEKQEKK